MGCNCKSKGKNNDLNEKTSTEELNIKGKILKIPVAIGLTVLFFCISPILLIYIWYLLMQQIFINKMLIFSFLKKFKRENNDDEKMDDFKKINAEDYVLMDVDKVK